MKSLTSMLKALISISIMRTLVEGRKAGRSRGKEGRAGEKTGGGKEKVTSGHTRGSRLDEKSHS